MVLYMRKKSTVRMSFMENLLNSIFASITEQNGDYGPRSVVLKPYWIRSLLRFFQIPILFVCE